MQRPLASARALRRSTMIWGEHRGTGPPPPAVMPRPPAPAPHTGPTAPHGHPGTRLQTSGWGGSHPGTDLRAWGQWGPWGSHLGPGVSPGSRPRAGWGRGTTGVSLEAGGAHLGADFVQARAGGAMGVSLGSRPRAGWGQGDHGGLTWGWGGPWGSHLGADLVQAGGDVLGGALAAEDVALEHLRQLVPGHVGKVPAGRGCAQDPPNPSHPSRPELPTPGASTTSPARDGTGRTGAGLGCRTSPCVPGQRSRREPESGVSGAGACASPTAPATRVSPRPHGAVPNPRDPPPQHHWGGSASGPRDAPAPQMHRTPWPHAPSAPGSCTAPRPTCTGPPWPHAPHAPRSLHVPAPHTHRDAPPAPHPMCTWVPAGTSTRRDPPCAHPWRAQTLCSTPICRAPHTGASPTP